MSSNIIHSFIYFRYIHRRNSDEDHGIGTRLITMQGDKGLIKDLGKVIWKEQWKINVHGGESLE